MKCTAAPRRPGACLLLGLAAALLTALPAVAQVGPSVPVPVPPTPEPPAAPPQPGATVAAAERLVGTFRFTAGSCGGAGITGSYFRMIQPGGSATAGPFVQNSDSPCQDKTYTPLAGGRDGGLVTGDYQPHPDPAFDQTGAGRADRLTRPEKFYGVNFSTATNPVDPQTGARVGAPELSVNGGRLEGDLRSFAAAWNNQHFNQGSPKPDGSRPGNTSGPTGTYDAGSRAFTLDWTSHIVGGPFNNFTGLWHFDGTFSPASAGAAAPAPQAGQGPSRTPSPAPGARPTTQAPRQTGAAGAERTTPRTGPPFAAGWPLALLVTGLAGARLARRAGIARR